MQIQSQPQWINQRLLDTKPNLGFATEAGGMMPAATAPQMSGTEVKQNKPIQNDHNQNDFYEEKRQGHGNASTWMSLYKFCGPLMAGIGYGAVFGSPLGFAAGVSLLVSSLQAGAALKIHKEDTPWAKDIVHASRKLMGREKDHSAAGKEWSMVPVWGAICGMAGLIEASINHGLAHKFPRQNAEKLMQKTGRFARIFHLQGRSMKYIQRKKEQLFGDEFKKKLPELMKTWPKALENKFNKSVQGNAKLGYLAGVGIACIGGMVQSAMAAKIQERIDAKHAEKANKHVDAKTPAEKVKSGAQAETPANPESKAAPKAESQKQKDEQKQEKNQREADSSRRPEQRSENKPEQAESNAHIKPKNMAETKGKSKLNNDFPQTQAIVQNLPNQAIANPSWASNLSPDTAEKQKKNDGLHHQAGAGNAWAMPGMGMTLAPVAFPGWGSSASLPIAQTIPPV